MASVENRVVSIKFNNSSFQQKISGTLASLKKLSEGLKLTGATKGMEDVSKSAKNLSLSSATEAVGGLSKSFVALSTVAITALSNITNRAVDAGLNIAKALTIEPLTDGFGEYELKMGSIQTIMAGTGESLETVNGYLNDLNTYSDRTIYSFADMTQNIGKFTNAGVSLESSVAAIQGVANVAALAGANSQQASNAMYNFSQALATGSVKLIDWKSIENAGLATVGFKEQLLEGAVAAGTLTKDAEGLYQTLDGVPVDTMANFNATLQEGWLSSEALVTTLEKYSDESTEVGAAAAAAATDVKTFSQAIDTIKESLASGWASSFELVFGDFEEGKALWTEFEGAVSGVFAASAEMRNGVLKDWRDLDGRKKLLHGIRNTLRAVSNIVGTVKDAFRELFPAKTGKDLERYTVIFQRFAKRLVAFTRSTENMDKIKSIFKGIFSVFKIGVAVVKGIFSVFTKVFGLFAGGAGGGLLTFGAKIGDFVYNLQEALVSGGGIASFFDKIGDAVVRFVNFVKGVNLTPAIDAIKSFGREVQETFSEIFGKIDFGRIGKEIQKVVNSIKGLFGGAASGGAAGGAAAASTSISTFTTVIEALQSALRGIGDALKEAWDGIVGVGEGAKDAGSAVGNFASTIGGKVKEAFGVLGDSIGSAFSDGFSVDKLLDVIKVALAGGLLVIIGQIIKTIKGGFGGLGGGFLDNINEALEGVTGVLKGMELKLKADALMRIAGAIAIMAGAMILLSLVPSDKLWQVGGGITAAVVALVGAAAAINELGSTFSDAGQLLIVAGALILMAGAIGILGLALGLFVLIPEDKIVQGMGAVVVALAALVVAANGLHEIQGQLVKAAIAMGLMAVAVILLAGAVFLFSLIPEDKLIRGGAAVIGALTALTIAIQGLPPEGQFAKAAASMILMSGALYLIAGAVAIFGTMDWPVLLRGMGATAAALGILVGTMILLEKADAKEGAIAIGGAAAALKLIASAVTQLGALSMGELAKGIGSIVLILGALIIMLDGFTAAIAGAAALLLTAAALVVMAYAIKQFGGVSWGSIGKGLAVMAAALVLLVATAYGLNAMVVVLVALGAAIFLFGAGVALAGVGALAFATALQIFATVGGAAITTFMAFLDQLIEKLPQMALAAGAAVGAFAEGFISNWPQLLETLATLILSLLDKVIEMIPKFLEIVGLLTDGLITYLSEKAPDLIEAGLQLLLSLLQGISDNIEEIAQTAIDIVIKFLDTVSENMGDIVAKGAELLVEFLRGISDNIGDVLTAAGDVIAEFILGVFGAYGDILQAGWDALKEFLRGITDNITEALTMGGEMIAEIIEGVGDAADDIVDAGFNALTSFLRGISDNIQDAVDEGFDIIVELINGVANAIDENIEDLREAGKNLAGAIINGMTLGLGEKAADVYEKAKEIADNVIEKLKKPWEIFSPSRVTRRLGGHLMEGLDQGMDKGGVSAVRTAGIVGDNVLSAFQQTLNKIPDALIGVEDFNPTISPVLDLTDLKRDAKGISGLLNGGVAANSYAQADLISHSHEARVRAEIEDEATIADRAPRDVQYIQNNYSPEALSTNDIYRGTRNLITLTKEELVIP